MEYVAITADKLEQFASLMLPQLYRQLQQLGDCNDTEEGTLLALGAYCAGEPAGALVAILEVSGDIGLLSLFVCAQHQRQGVATALVELLLRVASGCYVGKRDGDSNCIMLKTSYLLTDTQLAAFRPFLESAGFTSFALEGYAYGIDSTALAQCHMLRQAFADDTQPDPHILPLASLTTAERLELLEDAGNGDFLDEEKRDWSYGYRVGDDITDLLLTERGYGNSIVLRERGDLDGCNSGSLLALLTATLRTAHRQLGAFRLYVEDEDVLDKDVLEYLQKHGAVCYCKQLAWGQITL